jgi:hypothetical protein
MNSEFCKKVGNISRVCLPPLSVPKAETEISLGYASAERL